ncbi:TPA: Com family DNA-binding transcriptional regulator [Citrobacter freundii]|nr:Com family DNA-binding transcriptional regulator [Citrobacter freundii]
MSEKKSEQPLRCGQCQRLLAIAGDCQRYNLHIKCPRCKTLNHFTHSHRAA